MEQIIPVIILIFFKEFENLFSKTEYKYFCGYMLGLLICPGKKYLSNIAEISVFHIRSVSGWSRFLSKSSINISMIIERLIQVLLTRFKEKILHDGQVLAALDTTLIAIFGKKMLGTQTWHDHSGNSDRGGHLIGHHWGLIGLLVKGEYRWFCLPLIIRLIYGQKAPSFISCEAGVRKATFWDVALALCFELQQYLCGYPLIIVADAYFSKAPFINGLREKGIHLISRLRKDAVGRLEYHSPEKKRGRGRPRKYGESVKLKDLLRTGRHESCIVKIYGKVLEVNYVTALVYLREVKDLVRVVVVKNTDGYIILMSTDIDISPAKIIEYYAARFSIEISIKEMKSNLGLCDYQCYTTQSIYRHVQLVCFCYTFFTVMSWMADIKEWLKSFSFVNAQHSYTEGGIQYLKKVLRSAILDRLFFCTLNSQADFEKFKIEQEQIYKKLCRFIQ